MRLRLGIALLVGFSAGSAAAAPVETIEGRDILKRAAQAAAKLGAISYVGQYYGEGTLANQVQKITGSVTARRAENGQQPRVRIDAETKLQPADAPFRLTAACDGNRSYYVHERDKVFLTGGAPELNELPVGVLLPRRHLGDQAFMDELRGAEMRKVGQATLDGATCDIVQVTYDTQGQRSGRLFIGQGDAMLRRIEQSFLFRLQGQATPQTGTIVVNFSSLNTSPKTDPHLFSMEPPKGYATKSIADEVAASRPKPPPAPVVGQEAPDWTLKTFDGSVLSLKDLRGKVVIMDFWATWCGPCMMAIPGLQKIHEKYKGKPVEVLGLNVWERNSDPMAVLKRKGVTYRQLMSADRVAGVYRVRGIPAIFVVGPDGKILDVISGYDPDEERRFSAVIDRALAGK